MDENEKRSGGKDLPSEAKTINQTVGLEDVTRSVRALLRSGRSLGTSTLEVAERELAMAISISESIRDDVVSQEALERARKGGVMMSLRRDGHRMVDLLMDASSIAIDSGLDFLEKFADQRRPSLSIDSKAVRVKDE